MNEERRKQLCDAIISHLKNNPDTKYFGRESIIDVFIGKASRDELNSAIEWLRENRFIKKMGAYTLGFGTGEGLKPYPLDNFDPFVLQGKPLKQKVSEPIKQVVMRNPEWRSDNVEASDKPKHVEVKEAEVLSEMIADWSEKAPERAENMSVDTVKTSIDAESTPVIEPIPQFVEPSNGDVSMLCKSARVTPLKTVLNDEINSIEHALKKSAASVEQRYEKIGVLTRLSLIFSEHQPEVSAPLDGIVTDFIELTEVMA